MAVQYSRRGRGERRPAPPLDVAALQALALAYAARYATTEARLGTYLKRKIRERGWDGEGDPGIAAIVTRLADLRYVDDSEFARARSDGLKRRGFGPAKIAANLNAAGIERDMAKTAAQMDNDEMLRGARDFCARRRFAATSDPKESRRQFAALARAGYPFDIARQALTSEKD